MKALVIRISDCEGYIFTVENERCEFQEELKNNQGNLEF